MMLKLITLEIIDKIFQTQAVVHLPAQTKMLYINCLMHYFRDLKPSPDNAMAFDLFQSDFKPYEKFEESLQQLHKAKLIQINNKTIQFLNYWGPYIDRAQLISEPITQDPDNKNVIEKSGLIEDFKNELLESQSLIELICMRHKVKVERATALVKLFVKEQETFKKVYAGYSDCLRHCNNWIDHNFNKTPRDTKKSKPKLIGFE